MNTVGHVSASRLRFLSAEQRDQLAALFSPDGASVMPHEIANKLGVRHEEGLAVLAVLESAGICNNLLLIYHQCDPSVAAGAAPLRSGWPPLPWHCPLCEGDVDSYDELGFDVLAKSLGPIEFV